MQKGNRVVRSKPAAAKSAAPTYQLKVTLAGSEPPIWRRLSVPGDANLGWLHAVLQVALGWTNSHLHQFLAGQVRYTNPEYTDGLIGEDSPERDEAKAILMAVAPAEGAHFTYEYDFGDSWEHEIIVEEILPPAPAAAPGALCLEGARACPPEDCGGIWGYADLLKILKNPKHPDHKEMKGWLGKAFDPENFKQAAVNSWLRKLKWPRVTEAQLRTVLMARDGNREE